MTVFHDDGQIRFYLGNAVDILQKLPPESVHMVVTSPPYWGLRDYGTATWEGGDAECIHDVARWDGPKQTQGAQSGHAAIGDRLSRDTCGTCGARRVDQQLGLEATPEEFTASMVDVFREVRRVLRKDGTCWINIGDSYNANTGAGFNGNKRLDEANRSTVMKRPEGIKPKDLVGIPWMLAFALRADGWYLRSAITWCKENPMPESVRDRPTKATEMVFLLSKSPRYYFDQTALAAACARDNDAISEVQWKREDVHDLRAGKGTQRVLQAQGWAEPRGHLQGMREGTSDRMEGDAGGQTVVTSGDPEVQRVGAREGKKGGVGAFGRKKGLQREVRPVGEGALISGSASSYGETSGGATPILREWQGEGSHSPLPGDCEGEGVAVAGGTQAQDGTGSFDIDGQRVASDTEGVREPVRVLRGEGDSTDSGSHRATDEGRAARGREHRASVPELQQQEGQQGASYPNARDFWLLATEPFAAAHFATFPTAIPRRAILAGTSERGCCAECGAPWERVVEKSEPVTRAVKDTRVDHGLPKQGNLATKRWDEPPQVTTLGWRPTCSHEAPTVPATVLDPFLGSGTTAMVARSLGRRAIGIDLNREYLELAKNRCAQMGLLI